VLQTELPLTKLLPIDSRVDWHGVNEYLRQHCSGDSLDSVCVLPFPTDESDTYAVLDGHHKAKAAYVAGRTAIGAEVYTSDDEVRNFVMTQRSWWPRDAITKDRLRERCKAWIEDAKQNGAPSIASMPEAIRYYGADYEEEVVIVMRDGHPVGLRGLVYAARRELRWF